MLDKTQRFIGEATFEKKAFLFFKSRLKMKITQSNYRDVFYLSENKSCFDYEFFSFRKCAEELNKCAEKILKNYESQTILKKEKQNLV